MARESGRSRCFWGALAVITAALLSPLDALAGDLASVHMVQHVLLVLVAAPLLALSAPLATIMSGFPLAAQRAVARTRRRLPLLRHAVGTVQSPAVAWLLHTGALWFWHASQPYDAALEHQVIHAAEHMSLVVTGVLFWSALVQVRHAPKVSHGYAALLVFAMAMQSVFLAALLTFATTPWYGAYRDTTTAWGIEPLADQQLAGAIMWVPAGLIYVGVGVLLVVAWIRVNTLDTFPDGRDDDWGFRTASHPLAPPVGSQEQRRPHGVVGEHQIVSKLSNVETAGDSPVWHRFDRDVLPAEEARDTSTSADLPDSEREPADSPRSYGVLGERRPRRDVPAA